LLYIEIIAYSRVELMDVSTIAAKQSSMYLMNDEEEEG
jgi:hypothetical protein